MTADPATLASLRRRVEQGTGSDMELDGDIFAAFSEGVSPYEAARAWLLHPYTVSMDASIGLVERLLPEWRWTLMGDPHGYACRIMPGSPMTHPTSAPRALLSALLSALEAQHADPA